MTNVTEQEGSSLERYAWTGFVALGAFVVLIGVSDLTSSGSNSTLQENAVNELFIGLLSIVVAIGGLRCGERWAWYAMSLWPVWIVVQGARALSAAKSAEAISAVVFLMIVLVALLLSYRRSFRPRA
jgi:hypothetical protein